MIEPILVNRLLGLSRHQKTLLVLAIDGFLVAWAGWAAIYLRLGYSHWLSDNQLLVTVVPIPFALAIFWAIGMYRSIFRHSGTELGTLALGVGAFGLPFALIVTGIGIDRVPRTIGLIQPILLFVSMVAVRSVAFATLRPRTNDGGTAESVLIYGAGQTGRQLATVLRGDQGLRAIGFVDDDTTLHDRSIQGLPVFSPGDVARKVKALDVRKIFIAVPTASRFRRREIIESLSGLGVELRMLPGLADVAKGDFSISDVRQVQIEDLLGREPVQPDAQLLFRDVGNRTVMVTGAGGSIGSELSRQILTGRPHKLILVDSSEYALYAIDRELQQLRGTLRYDTIEIVPVLGLVQEESQMRAIYAAHRPQTIYHAAAYKHVPLVEANALRGIENNGLGTHVTAGLAREFGAESFVLISTDKAVRPTNVMGATKRLAELSVQALALEGGATRFCCVRFGNVLGSSGSVVPLFREQIARGGPITLTHPDVTRYFMTIPEAAQLVIQAGVMATGGEVFLLEMGEPVRIIDLAVNMVRLSGLSVRGPDNPQGDIEIRMVGLRPGEKLYEELLIDSSAQSTEHPQIMRAQEPAIGLAALAPRLAALEAAIRSDDPTAGIFALRELVPGYRPGSH